MAFFLLRATNCENFTKVWCVEFSVIYEICCRGIQVAMSPSTGRRTSMQPLEFVHKRIRNHLLHTIPLQYYYS